MLRNMQYTYIQQSVAQYSIVECSTVHCSAAVVQFILLKPLKSNFLQFLEETSTGHCVGAILQGPHTLHRDKMTPTPSPLLYCTVLCYTLLNIGVPCVAMNISIRYGSEQVMICCSYVFCHKMVLNGQILVFEVSIELY